MYRAAGWHGVLPLGARPGKKYPPPHGWTGHGAPYPSAADVEAWRESHGDRNIGLRLPPGVLGLDVDAYANKLGGETLHALVAKYGELPPTWITTARTDGVSGIRLFRVPTELDGREINWPGEAGTHIEIIQTGHRYAVVWPSTNPEAAGARYEWRWGASDLPSGEALPRIDELADLPEAWVRGLALSYDRTEKADLGRPELSAWLQAVRRGGTTCPTVATVASRAMAALRDVDGSRHETARDAAAAIARLAGEGHMGALDGLAAVEAGFVAAVGKERAVDNGEWQRLLAGAIRLAAASNREPRQSCDHDAVTAIEAPPGFGLPGPVDGSPAAPPALAAPDPGSAAIVDDAITRIEQLAGAERDAAVRALAAELVAANVSESEQQRARATVTTKAGFSDVGLTEFAELLRAAKRERKEATEYQARLAAHANARALIDQKRAEGALLPPPHAPIDVARELAAQLPRPARWWRGDFYLWDGTRYALWRDEAVDNWLYGRTADAFYEGGEDKGPAPWRPTENKITGVAHALGRGVLYRPSEADVDDSPTQVACANGVYDVPTGELLPHTPERFNLQAVPFSYEPDADSATWRAFLDDTLPKDAQQFLQEWFGYVLSGRTDLEKIANLVGPPRSGKGTIATVLEALLGGENVASPSMPSLVGTFGEQPLIGKTLAVFSDISWSHRDIVTGVEILKAISGQDTRDVNRKNREIWHGRLGVRFLIMGNDMPKFTDASGALAGRMIHVQFTRSVAGREDPTLKPRLLDELPGILNWALEGLRRLGANGRFTVPQTSAELAAEVRRQQSPVQGFLDDCCAYSEAANPVPLDELHPVYRAWARAADVEHPLDRERFSRALSSAGLTVRRERIAGVRARRVYGVTPAALTAWTELVNPLGAVPPVH